MARSAWQEYAAKALRAAGPTRHDKAQALKRAGEEWRGMRHHHMESNPSGGVVKFALIGAAVYFGYKMVTKPKAAAPVPPAPGTTNGTARAQSTTAI